MKATELKRMLSNPIPGVHISLMSRGDSVQVEITKVVGEVDECLISLVYGALSFFRKIIMLSACYCLLTPVSLSTHREKDIILTETPSCTQANRQDKKNVFENTWVLRCSLI